MCVCPEMIKLAGSHVEDIDVLVTPSLRVSRRCDKNTMDGISGTGNIVVRVVWTYQI